MRPYLAKSAIPGIACLCTILAGTSSALAQEARVPPQLMNVSPNGLEEWIPERFDGGVAGGGGACALDCPAGAIIEAEPCGADTNGGCNLAPPAFEVVSCGDTVCGTAFADAGTRDTDWYELFVPDPDGNGFEQINLTITSQIPVVMFVLELGAPLCSAIALLDDGAGFPFSDACVPGSGSSLCLAAPATYYLFAATGTAAGAGVFDGFPCGGPLGNDYVFTVECKDCGGPPPGPDNDNCVDRIFIFQDVPTDFDTTLATTDGPPAPAGCTGGPGPVKDIWFNWDSGFTGEVDITTCEELGGSATFDTVIVVYDGCSCGPLPPVLGCNDDDTNNACGSGAGGFHSTVNVPVVAGNCYKIQVGGFSGTAGGPGTLLIAKRSAEPPCPKDFEVLAPGVFNGTTCGAGNDIDLRPSEDHSYTVTIPNDGDWTFALCGSSFDTYIFLGTECGLGDIASNDDSCGLQSQVTATLTAGEYWVTIEAFGSSQCGDYTLEITKAPPGNPPECDDPNSGDCCVANGSPGCDRKDCCVAICANDAFCCNTEWDGICAAAAEADTVNCPQCAPPPGPNNDLCANRRPIFNGETPFDTTLASTDGPGVPCTPIGPVNEIWWNYTADFTGDINVTTCEELGGSADFDTVLVVYDGCDCDPLSPILGCNDDDPNNFCGTGAGGFHSTVSVPVVAGNCYKIRLGGFSGGSSGTGVLNIVKKVPPTSLDIKPGSCPNSYNRGSHGVLPVALVGSADFDVKDVDISSILLSRKDGGGGSVAPNEGPPGPASEFEDAATPFDGEEQCDCHDLEGDGIQDLMMHFKTDDVVAALGLNDFDPGALVPLTLSGNLLDGTPFSASDCVRLVPPGAGAGAMGVASNAPGVFIDITPLDGTLDGGGFPNFERVYPLTTLVTLTAPATHPGWVFVGWLYNPGPHQGGGGLYLDRTFEIIINDKEFWLKAIYLPATGDTLQGAMTP